VDFKTKIRARMGIWEAMEMLNTLVDESDPDVSGIPLSDMWHN
jgi:inositol oxygenase